MRQTMNMDREEHPRVLSNKWKAKSTGLMCLRSLLTRKKNAALLTVHFLVLTYRASNLSLFFNKRVPRAIMLSCCRWMPYPNCIILSKQEEKAGNITTKSGSL